MSNALNTCLLTALLVSVTAQAQQQRWFEVELIVFSQTPAATVKEDFATPVKPIKPGRAYDLLTARYQPDLTAYFNALPLCNGSETPAFEFQLMPLLPQLMCIFEAQPAPWQQQSLFQPVNIISTVPFPDPLPVTITGQGKHVEQPYLAPADALQLNELAGKINRLPGKAVLLHTSWRQAPVTERRAIASRWFAGKQWSQQFDYWGRPVTDQDAPLIDEISPSDTNSLPDDNYSATTTDLSSTARSDTGLLQQIDELLLQLQANNQLVPEADTTLATINTEQIISSAVPEQVWQLDGLFKLHLDHYLFVNTEFNLRVENAGQLDTVYVRQSRRVISGEVHYLDHPHLGIVLQIRRFEPIDDSLDETTTEMPVIVEPD